MRRLQDRGLGGVGTDKKGHLCESIGASNPRSRGVPGGNPGSQTCLLQVWRVHNLLGTLRVAAFGYERWDSWIGISRSLEGASPETET